MRFIALLRGINVGGHLVKMERLRQLFTEMGFADVRSYIQSGNVFFETEEQDRKALAQSIEKHLAQALGFAIPVILRMIPEMEQLLAGAPFQAMTATPEQRFCIVFLAEPFPTRLTVPIRSPRNDVEIIQTTAQEAFVVWHLLNGKPPVSEIFLKKTLGGTATTRFFHTAVKILEAAKKGEKENSGRAD